MRCRICPAALLVNVTARTRHAGIPSSKIEATRWQITLVFPVPAPARTSNGLPRCSTAARCGGLSDIATSYHEGATLRRNVSAAAPPPSGDDEARDTGDAGDTHRPPRFSLRTLARQRPLPVLALWLVLCAIAAWVLTSRGASATGDLDGLIAEEHRHPRDTMLVLVWFDPG